MNNNARIIAMMTLPLDSAFRNAYTKMIMTIKLMTELIILAYDTPIMLDKV